MPEPAAPPEGQETSDASPRVIIISGAALGIGLLVSLLLAASLWRGAVRATTAGPEFGFQHGPDQTTGIEADWRLQDDAVQRHLDSYGWVDQPAGRVRIPVKRAMELMLPAESGKERP
jgi:hypothetical protein